MGLGISVVLEPGQRQGTVRSIPSASRAATAFLEIAGGTAVIGRLARITGQDTDRWEVELIPTEEPVYFVQAGAAIEVSARTSSAGPGYHAYLCGLFDRLAARLNVRITETDELYDDTGYRANRDYRALQGEMAALFEGLSKVVLKMHGEGMDQIVVSLPADFGPVDHPGFALTQSGPRDRSFFEAGEANAPRHFPWWEEGLTPLTAFGLAEALDDVSLARAEQRDRAGDGRSHRAAH